MRAHRLCPVVAAVSLITIYLVLMLSPSETFNRPTYGMDVLGCREIFEIPEISMFHYDVSDAAGLKPDDVYSCDGCFFLNYTHLNQPEGLCDVFEGQIHDDLRVIFIILSMAAATEARDEVRSSWVSATQANHASRVRHMFLVGRAEDTDTQRRVDEEQIVHSDILQLDIIETKDGTVMQSMMGLKWVTTHCTRARYIMKTDADSFVNIARLLNLLSQVPPDVGALGCCQSKHIPNRNPSNKWYISHSAYPFKKFPPYCVVAGHILAMETAQHVVRVSPNVPFVRSEDVYVGLCLRAVHLEQQHKFRIHHYRAFLERCGPVGDFGLSGRTYADIANVIVMHPISRQFVVEASKNCFIDVPCS